MGMNEREMHGLKRERNKERERFLPRSKVLKLIISAAEPELINYREILVSLARVDKFQCSSKNVHFYIKFTNALL